MLNLVCERCDTKFRARLDHGKTPRFCSKECYYEGTKPMFTDSECAYCGAAFRAQRSSHDTQEGYRMYCSRQCANMGRMKREVRTCPHCLSRFEAWPSDAQECCSKLCSNEFHRGYNNKNWRGGFTRNSQNGDLMTLLRRPGYAGNYIAVHRLVASRAIGRMLFRHEVVIRISGEQDDVRPVNLFICASMSEYKKRHRGSLPWPTHSNLETYKDRVK